MNYRGNISKQIVLEFETNQFSCFRVRLVTEYENITLRKTRLKFENYLRILEYMYIKEMKLTKIDFVEFQRLNTIRNEIFQQQPILYRLNLDEPSIVVKV